MKVRSDSFVAGQPLPDALAFARPDPTSRVTLSDNRNPHLAWEDVPEAPAPLPCCASIMTRRLGPMT